MTVKCKNIEALKSLELTLSNNVEITRHSGGQTSYKYQNGFIANFYDNGTVTFQGKEINGVENARILEAIKLINSSVQAPVPAHQEKP